MGYYVIKPNEPDHCSFFSFLRNGGHSNNTKQDAGYLMYLEYFSGDKWFVLQTEPDNSITYFSAQYDFYWMTNMVLYFQISRLLLDIVQHDYAFFRFLQKDTSNLSDAKL